MLLVLDKSNIKKENICILNKTKNNIINNGYFYRIFYNCSFLNINGIYISFNLKNFKIDNYFNKYKCVFSQDENKEIIDFLKSIEKYIMNKSFFEGLDGLYRIEEQLSQNYIKIYSNENINLNTDFKDDEINFILKISGIWSEENQYGLTFRFTLSIGNK
mgnify:FL=1|tara:strand:- start:877 stop:1356 length:480 start_codon:yes stop_codon:yes gene_type:complete